MSFETFLGQVVTEVSKALSDTSSPYSFLIPKVIHQGIQMEFLVQFPGVEVTLDDKLLVLAGYFGWTFPKVKDLWEAYESGKFSVKVTLAVNKKGLPTGQIFMDFQ